MWVKILSGLILIAMVKGKAIHKVNDCGVSMEKGVVSANCTDFVSIRHWDIVSVVPCSLLNKTLYYSTVIVTHKNCTTILLDHKQCDDVGTGPCDYTKVSVYEVSFYILVSGCLLMLVILLPICCFMMRLGLTREFIKIKRANVELILPDKRVTYLWLQIFLIIYCCRSVKSHCMSPDVKLEGKVYSAKLKPGDQLCFRDGMLSHKQNSLLYSTNFLYKTAIWEKYIWSIQGCGNGELCGNKDDCGNYGKLGKVIQRKDKGMVYQKICSPFGRNFFGCPSMWGCWLATHEVSYSRTTYNVYSVGSYSDSDDYSIDGIKDCRVEVSSGDIGSLTGHFLVTDESNSWLCKTASEAGSPKKGTIGDLQLVDNEGAIFDFSAFQCEYSETESPGSCRVIKSAMKMLDDMCVKLPFKAGGEEWNYLSGVLTVSSTSPDTFQVLCSERHEVITSGHDCHSNQISLVGQKGDPGMTVYVFMAQSINSSSTWIIHSNCTNEHLEVPCDGSPHALRFHISEHIYCAFDGHLVQDLRKAPPSVVWSWADSDHRSYLPPIGQGITIGMILMLVLLLVLLKVICR